MLTMMHPLLGRILLAASTFSLPVIMPNQAALAGSADDACKTTGLTLGMDDYPPYRIEKKDSLQRGIDAEFLNAVAIDIGCKGIVEVARPWARQLRNCEDGELHLVSSATNLPEREKYAYITPSYMKGFNKIFMTTEGLKKYDKFKHLDDLMKEDKFRLASTTGASYSAYYDEMTKNPAFQRILDMTTDDINAIQKTLEGRNQAFIGDVATVGFHLKSLKADGKLIAHPMSIDEPNAPVDEGSSHIMISRKAFSKELAEKLIASSVKLRKDGTLDKIIEKYMTKELAALVRHTD